MKTGIAFALMATLVVSLEAAWQCTKDAECPTEKPFCAGNWFCVAKEAIGPADPDFNEQNSPTCFQSCDFYAPSYCETPWINCNPNKIGITGTEKIKDYCTEECKDKCDPNPCKNDGICYDGDCFCQGGCYGPTCEYCTPEPQDPCSPNPCENGGVCVNGKCNCPDHCSGTLCESCLAPCDPDPCKNDGPCAQTSDSCTCAGKRNNYGEGGECDHYTGYEDEWYNGAWCYADTATCSDAREHPAGAKHELPGYGASRLACNSDVKYGKITKKYPNDKYGEYMTLAEAQNACATDYNCQGVFDQGCDGGKKDNFWLIPRNVRYSNSGSSCIYQKTGYLSSGYHKLCGPCRNADGGQGWYDKHYSKENTLNVCQNKCNALSTCVAIEQNPTGGCELHKKGTVTSTGATNSNHCWFKL